jgi:hypothetical protein
MAGQLGKVGAFLLAAHGGIEHSHGGDQGRQANAGGRSRMHFVVQLVAKRIVGRKQAGIEFVHACIVNADLGGQAGIALSKPMRAAREAENLSLFGL